LASSALLKSANGDQLTQRESAALTRYNRTVEQDCETRHYYYCDASKFRRWLGVRTRKGFDEFSIRYGFDSTVSEDAISLPQFTRWFRNFLDRYGPVIQAADDKLFDAKQSLLLVKVERERIKLLVDQGKYVDAESLWGQLEWFACQIRNAGDRMQRAATGVEAFEILDEVLNEVGARIEQQMRECGGVSDDA